MAQLLPQGSLAQEPQLEEVLVTGSRIVRQDFEANSPIVTVTQELFDSTATIGIETILNQLPQFMPQYNQFVSQNIQPSALGTPGASVVNLRGLGANRTLVLINGRRGAPINATNVIDTNAIPSSAIERVEIVSGGASAVYGADAMAGVVNFILKDNFEGFEIDTQMGTTAEGDGEEFRFSALAGGNVNDGRGNFMLGAEYASREPALQVKRSWRVDELRNPYLSGSEFGVPTITRIDNDSVIIDTCPDPTTPGIDCALDVGNPFSQAAADAVFSELPPGTIPSTRTPGAPVPPDAVPVLTSWFVNPSPDGTGTVFAGVWGGQGGFNENTNGSPHAPAAYKYTGPLESPECGDAPFRKIMADGSLTQNNCSVRYSAPLERYALFGNGQLELSDRISAFIRGTFSRSRTDTVYSYLSATGVRDIGIPHGDEIYTGDPAAGVPSSLNEDGTTHEAYLPGGAYGLNCAPVGGCTLSEVWPTPPEVAALLDSRPNPNAPFRVDHPLTYLPRSTTKSVTTTYQLLVGLEGELDNGWRWDASVSQGETNNITHQPNYVARERLRTLANRPNYGREAVVMGNLEWFGNTGGHTTCTTGLPIFASFTPSEDCLHAISVDLQNTSLTEQQAVEANLTGSLAEMPAGRLQFALGASHRKNTFSYTGDSMVNNNSTSDMSLLLFPVTNSGGEQSVSELYGELLIPLTRRFDLELGGRYSDYDTSGGVDTYKALIDWRMTDFARLRGGFNRATRAPNIAELFLRSTQSAGAFGAPPPLYADPCTLNPITASPAPFGALSPDPEQAAHALAICREMMGATGQSLYYNRPVEQQPSTGGLGSRFTAGNPDVQPETADTWTAGFVINSPFENPWLEGLRFTIDYYSIDITDIISVESPDEPYRRCLSLETNPAGDINTPSCLQISRDPTDGSGSTIDVAYTNSGRARFSGYDLQIDWQAEFQDLAGFRWLPGGASINVLLTVPREQKTQNSPAAPEIDWKGTMGCALQLQCSGYDYQLFSTFNYRIGSFQASLRWGHVPKIDHATKATNPNTPFRGVLESADMLSLSVNYRFNDRLMLRGGIDNLLDERPPLQGGNPNATPMPLPPSRAGSDFGVDFGQFPLGMYDPLGRRFFLGLNVGF